MSAGERLVDGRILDADRWLGTSRRQKAGSRIGRVRREVFVGPRWVRSGSPEVIQMDLK